MLAPATIDPPGWGEIPLFQGVVPDSPRAENGRVNPDAMGTGNPIASDRGDVVTPNPDRDAARRALARADRDPLPCPAAVAAGAREIRPASRIGLMSAQLAASLRAENDALAAKLSRVSRAIQGLASELAASRRECRRQQLEINALRAENALLQDRLRAAA